MGVLRNYVPPSPPVPPKPCTRTLEAMYHIVLKSCTLYCRNHAPRTLKIMYPILSKLCTIPQAQNYVPSTLDTM